MKLIGSCHCSNLSYALLWPDSVPTIPARVDGCIFCTAHNAAWTSNREAELIATIRTPSLVNRYRFGTKTADFYVCTQCGVVPWVTSEIEGQLYAVVNVNTFTNVDRASLPRSSGNFDGEAVGDRLSRRAQNWIPNVTIGSSASD